MSTEVTTLVKLARFGSPLLKAVAWAMADYANKEGAGVYPSNGTVARDTEYSRRAVIGAVTELTDLGVLTTRVQSLGGAYKDTSVREFDLAVLLSISRGSKSLGIPEGPNRIAAVKRDGKRAFAIVPAHAEIDDEDDDDGSETAAPGTLNACQPVHHDHRSPVEDDRCTTITGEPGALDRCTRFTQTVIEPSSNPLTPTGGTKGIQVFGRQGGKAQRTVDAIVAAMLAETPDLPAMTALVAPLLARRRIAARGSDLAVVLADIRAAAAGFDARTCVALLDAALALAPAKVRADAVLGLVRHERDRRAKLAAEATAREARIAAVAADARVLGKRDAFDAALVDRLGRPTVDAWFADVVPVRLEGRELTIDTAKRLSANWIASRLYEPTLAAARAVFGHVENVRVTVSEATA